MQFTTYVKRLIYPLYIYPKINPKVRRKLHSLFLNYQKKQEKNVSGSGKEMSLFSNMEEDGIILKILASISIDKGFFIDIGSNDCINSNCANLAFNFDWGGVFIDANEELLKIGKRNYNLFRKGTNLKFVQSTLFPDNINNVICSSSSTVDIDFMSIDIDGNDYAIWQALETVRPKIVVIENKIEYGANDIIVPVLEKFSPSQWGASILSITKLAEEKGYTLVATNKEGFNSFYMRNDYLQLSYLQPLRLETVLESESVKKSFYPDSIMHPLLQMLASK